MRDRRPRAGVLVVSVVAVPVGALWASCGLAECDRADCGRVLTALASTSGFGLVVVVGGMVGICVSAVLLVAERLRR